MRPTISLRMMKAHVLVKPDTGGPASILLSEGIIQLYLADAMYIDGEEVIDFTE